VGVRHEQAHWRPLYSGAVAQVARWKSESERWQESSEQFQERSQQINAQLQDLQGKVESSVGDLKNPRFTLWNSCGAGGPSAGCLLIPGYEYVGGVPDTFTYFVSFRSTVPVTVYIMSAHDFVCWETKNCAWRWVGWTNQTELQNGVFHQAEGCAGYFAVFFSAQAGTLYPNVRITRNPASHSTGTCQ